MPNDSVMRIVPELPYQTASDRKQSCLPMKFPFTRARLDAVTVPTGKKHVIVYDKDQKGLAFIRYASGSSKFYFWKKISRTVRRYPIADGTISVIDARKLVIIEQTKYDKGLDAFAVRVQERQQMTVADLFEYWKSIKQGKIRSIDQYESFFNYAAAIHRRKIDQVLKADVESIHAKIGKESGPYTANRVLATLSIIFRWSSKEYKTRNPVEGIERFPETSRERFLQPDELVRFNKAIDSEPDPLWKDLWKMLLYTGQRRNNVCGMEWADVDLINRCWRIPARSAKGKRMITVPLTDESIALLERRRNEMVNERFVFPSYSSTGRIMEPKAAWKRLLERAGIKDLRIHDIRRTVGSYMAISGVSDRLIGSALGQSTAQATAVYARLRSEEVRNAMATGMSTLRNLQVEAEKKTEKSHASNKSVSHSSVTISNRQ